MFKVFYSWQSDLPPGGNRSLILGALEKACATLTTTGGVAVEAVVDRDTLGLSGAPDIKETILAKIADADAFVADVSIITDGSAPAVNGEQRRPCPNPNVLLEAGYALAQLGNEAIVLVCNTHYGPVEQLPFDLRPLRVLTYNAAPGEDRSEAKKTLETALRRAIAAVASTVRADPVYAMVHPRTLQIAGSAEGIVKELGKLAGKPSAGWEMTEEDISQICKAIHPNAQFPLMLGIPQNGGRYANVLEGMRHWRQRSRKSFDDLMVFAGVLRPEHLALAASVEQCTYFQLLDVVTSIPFQNDSISIFAPELFSYLIAAKRLRDYGDKRLSRRANTF